MLERQEIFAIVNKGKGLDAGAWETVPDDQVETIQLFEDEIMIKLVEDVSFRKEGPRE